MSRWRTAAAHYPTPPLEGVVVTRTVRGTLGTYTPNQVLYSNLLLCGSILSNQGHSRPFATFIRNLLNPSYSDSPTGFPCKTSSLLCGARNTGCILDTLEGNTGNQKTNAKADQSCVKAAYDCSPTRRDRCQSATIVGLFDLQPAI